MSPIKMWQDMPKNDRMFLVGSVVLPLLVFIVYRGRDYSMKGLRRNG